MKKQVLKLVLTSLLICLPAQAGVTIEQSLRGGCFTSGQTKGMFDSALARITATVTTQKLTERFSGQQFRDNSITKTYVTSETTWVFRGYDGPDDSPHVTALKNGYLASKSQMRLDKAIAKGNAPRQEIIDEFWAAYGPDVGKADDNGRNPTTIILRLLAIQSSDEPPSQFVSVATDFNTASAFGNPVYAFQANPNSPLLGLVGCRLEGEYQLQIPNGTKITNLHRKFRNKGWEKYDPHTNTWISVSYNVPPPNAAHAENLHYKTRVEGSKTTKLEAKP